MKSEEADVWEGTSHVGFEEAAYKAIAAAEADRGDEAPLEFDITLRATRAPGRSLSEYVVRASPHD